MNSDRWPGVAWRAWGEVCLAYKLSLLAPGIPGIPDIPAEEHSRECSMAWRPWKGCLSLVSLLCAYTVALDAGMSYGGRSRSAAYLNYRFNRMPLSRRRTTSELHRSPLSRRNGPISSQTRVADVARQATPEISVAESLADPELVGAVTQEQLLVGFVAGVFPFVWAAFEFWKRIDTQQRCGVCQGSGLVLTTKTGKEIKVPRKCYACGGFLPWQGWRAFWLSNLDMGNGGVLQRPAPDYEELSRAAKVRRREDGGE